MERLWHHRGMAIQPKNNQKRAEPKGPTKPRVKRTSEEAAELEEHHKIAFARHLIEGCSIADSYRKAYSQPDMRETIAHNRGKRLKRSPEIKQALVTAQKRIIDATEFTLERSIFDANRIMEVALTILDADAAVKALHLRTIIQRHVPATKPGQLGGGSDGNGTVNNNLIVNHGNMAVLSPENMRNAQDESFERLRGLGVDTAPIAPPVIDATPS